MKLKLWLLLPRELDDGLGLPVGNDDHPRICQFVNYFALGFAGLGAGIGVGLIGMGATQAVGRNPSAFGNILTIGIIGMALAEAIAIYAFIMALQG